MLHLTYRIFLRSCSLVLCLFLLGCPNGPDITVCLIDANNFQLACSDPNGKKFTRPITISDNYVCMSPNDTRTLVEYCKLSKDDD